MVRPNVHLIVAVGQSGQIGLDGGLPWPRELGDLSWFRAKTIGNVVIFGGRTAASVGPLTGRWMRTWNGRTDPKAFLDRIEEKTPFFDIFVAGGAHTYRAFAPFASKWLITRIDYDGPADTFWPFSLPWAER